MDVFIRDSGLGGVVFSLKDELVKGLFILFLVSNSFVGFGWGLGLEI